MEIFVVISVILILVGLCGILHFCGIINDDVFDNINMGCLHIVIILFGILLLIKLL